MLVPWRVFTHMNPWFLVGKLGFVNIPFVPWILRGLTEKKKNLLNKTTAEGLEDASLTLCEPVEDLKV